MDFTLSAPNLDTERIGNTDTPGVWLLDSESPGPTVMISALIHGNELCGAWALKEILQHGIQPSKGRLILAFCHLQSFDQFDPKHPDRSRFIDEDMNRVWSLDRLTQGHSIEQQRAQALQPWVEQADFLLDLHSMHEPSAPLALTGTLARNIEFAHQLGAPTHIIVDAGHKDGVRMRDYQQFSATEGRLGQSVLIECGYHGDPQSKTVALDMVARLLLQTELVGATQLPTHWLQSSPAKQIVLEVTHAVVAPSMDVQFSQDWQGLETLERAGSLIGYADGQAIVTPYDDCTLIMPSLRQLMPGVTIVRLARERGL